MTTVKEGQIRDEIKRRLERLIEQPEAIRRLKVGEAVQWLRLGAPGRALEVLESILSDYEKADIHPSHCQCAQCQFERGPHGQSLLEPPKRLPCGCPVEMRSLCPHGYSDLA